jgi:hypothetical protein
MARTECPGVDGAMPLLRTALALALALALAVPSGASAGTDAGTARALSATRGSTATMRALLACHSTPACQRIAARSLGAHVGAMAAGVLLRDSQYRCELLALERAYAPAQNALAAWAARPDAVHARVAMGALQSWYTAVDARVICAR